MREYSGILLFFLIFQTTIQKSYAFYLGKMNNTKRSEDISGTIKTVNCFLTLRDKTIRHTVKESIKQGRKLLHLDLKLEENLEPRTRGMEKSFIYQPLKWIRYTGIQGKEILNYDERVPFLSMTMLGQSVEVVTISLKQSPSKCLFNLSSDEYEGVIRDFLLHDFSNSSEGKLGDTERICNMHLRPHTKNTALFYYKCCHISDNDIQHCTEDFDVSESYAAMVITFVTIMMVPFIFKNLFYDTEYLTFAFFRRQATYRSDLDTTRVKIYDSQSEGHRGDMDNERVNILISRRKLLMYDEAPFTILQTLYKNFISCDYENKIIDDCCQSEFRVGVKWQTCLNLIMQNWPGAVISILVTLRFVLYILFENDEVNSRSSFAELHGIEPYTNSATFIFKYSCCFFLFFQGCLLSILQCSKETFRQVFTFCLTGLRNVDIYQFFNWMIYFTFLALPKEFKLFGLLLDLFVFPVSVLICLFLIFLFVLPLSRFYISLIELVMKSCLAESGMRSSVSAVKKIFQPIFGEAFFSAEVPRSIGKHRCALSIIIYHFFCSWLAFIFIGKEIALFLSKLLIYNLVGLIQNWESFLPIVVFLSLVIVNGVKCWTLYIDAYRNFNKMIHIFLRERIHNFRSTQDIMNSTGEKSVALVIPTSNGHVTEPTISMVERTLTSNKMLMFFDANQKSYILKQSFKQITNSDHFGGKKLTEKATQHFAYFIFICIFILFLFFTVRSFISGTNQIIVLIVTGAIPWVFEKVSARKLSFGENIVTISQMSDAFDELLQEEIELNFSSPEYENLNIFHYPNESEDEDGMGNEIPSEIGGSMNEDSPFIMKNYDQHPYQSI